MTLDLLRGESRGHWEYHVPDKKFRQAKAVGKINNEKTTLLCDSGAEVSILDAAFARKVGWYADNNQELKCEGVGKNSCVVDGRTRIKITLTGTLVYYFDAWIGRPTGGKHLILGGASRHLPRSGRRIDESSIGGKWIADLKTHLKEDVGGLTTREAKTRAKIADDYELDDNDLLLYCPWNNWGDEDRDSIAKMVVPETLQQNFIHHYHA
ncbi:hypothetical protein PR001_g4353 [Phytophthora rubi]|uniref:Peptidase A2 domain-containing protein n=1 Tax=Phytophthora rubi TaxID=129364 RepID=A0A6A3NWK3_9STRA|nr:hypothetical protein PR001_g4353 [Phytophthora rubi]